MDLAPFTPPFSDPACPIAAPPICNGPYLVVPPTFPSSAYLKEKPHPGSHPADFHEPVTGQAIPTLRSTPSTTCVPYSGDSPGSLPRKSSFCTRGRCRASRAELYEQASIDGAQRPAIAFPPPPDHLHAAADHRHHLNPAQPAFPSLSHVVRGDPGLGESPGVALGDRHQPGWPPGTATRSPYRKAPRQ